MVVSLNSRLESNKEEEKTSLTTKCPPPPHVKALGAVEIREQVSFLGNAYSRPIPRAIWWS